MAGRRLMVQLFLQKVRTGSEELQISIWTERMHLRTQRNLTDISVKPLYLIFQGSQRSKEVSDDNRKESVESAFKGAKRDELVNYRHDSLTLVSKKLMEQVLQRKEEDREYPDFKRMNYT